MCTVDVFPKQKDPALILSQLIKEKTGLAIDPVNLVMFLAKNWNLIKTCAHKIVEEYQELEAFYDKNVNTYTTRHADIEARRFITTVRQELEELANWCNGHLNYNEEHPDLSTIELSGARLVVFKDWIIRDPDGTARSINHEDFHQLYKVKNDD